MQPATRFLSRLPSGKCARILCRMPALFSALSLATLLIPFLVFFSHASPASAREDSGKGIAGRSFLTGSIDSGELPPEALTTLAAIKNGGPFPFRKDGTVFGNREKRLPAQPHGYYREYTVTTPYRSDRGARRIVAGAGPGNDVRTSGEYYYTSDHYRSFRRIVETGKTSPTGTPATASPGARSGSAR